MVEGKVRASGSEDGRIAGSQDDRTAGKYSSGSAHTTRRGGKGGTIGPP